MVDRILVLNLILTAISLIILIYMLIGVILGYHILAQWKPLIQRVFDDMI